MTWLLYALAKALLLIPVGYIFLLILQGTIKACRAIYLEVDKREATNPETKQWGLVITAFCLVLMLPVVAAFGLASLAWLIELLF